MAESNTYELVLILKVSLPGISLTACIAIEGLPSTMCKIQDLPETLFTHKTPVFFFFLKIKWK